MPDTTALEQQRQRAIDRQASRIADYVDGYFAATPEALPPFIQAEVETYRAMKAEDRAALYAEAVA